MKKLVLSLVVAMGVAAAFVQNAQAKIWRVNSYSNYNGTNLWGDNYGGSEAYPVFKTLPQVVAAAGNGDSIYVEPGYYDNTTVSKKLTLIGPGFFHTNGLSKNASLAHFDGIGFNDGAEGSRVIGIYFRSSNYSIVFSCSDLSIERCWIENFGISLIIPLNNIKVTSCFFGPDPSNNPSPAAGTCFREDVNSNLPVTNFEVSNCIFRCPVEILKSTFDKFNNNTLELPFSANPTLDIRASKCFNNIIKRASNIVGTNTAKILVDCDSIKNCISYAPNQFGSDATLGNIQFTTTNQQNELFVSPSGSTDAIFRLKPAYLPGTANPASNLGTDGTQRGAFGGEFPYSLSGLGPIPVVKDIVTNGNNTPGQGINLKISAGTVK